LAHTKNKSVDGIGGEKVGAGFKGTMASSRSACSSLSLKALQRKNRRCHLCGQKTFQMLHSFDDFDLIRCKKCGLVATSLFLERSALAQTYSATYYKKRPDYYFNNVITNHTVTKENGNIRDFRNGLSLIAQYKSKGRLLDVGCALGTFLFLARQSGWDTYGVDISQYATHFARDALKLQVHTGELEEAKFPDKWFDVITLWDVLEHFPDPSRQLQEIHRILQDDGVVLMNTPNEAAFLRLLAWKMFRLTGGKIRYPLQKLYHRFHLYYFTSETLYSLLEQNGFTLIQLNQKCIPIVKARGSKLEQLFVKVFSLAERLCHREYELLAIVGKH
jgi:2-polyprenyl-3-methyl-5-hydroxy-6-metoxy-1,4-benzoquinol methylase